MPCGAFKNAKNMAISDYLKETRAELTHVTWPTRSQTVNSTIAVIAVSAVVALVLFGFDELFIQLIKKFVLKQ